MPCARSLCLVSPSLQQQPDPSGNEWRPPLVAGTLDYRPPGVCRTWSAGNDSPRYTSPPQAPKRRTQTLANVTSPAAALINASAKPVSGFDDVGGGDFRSGIGGGGKRQWGGKGAGRWGLVNRAISG